MEFYDKELQCLDIRRKADIVEGNYLVLLYIHQWEKFFIKQD